MFLIRGGIFIEGRVEVWPGLPQVASALGLTHVFPGDIVQVLLRTVLPYQSSPAGEEGQTGLSAGCTFLLCMCHGFRGQSFLFRC